MTRLWHMALAAAVLAGLLWAAPAQAQTPDPAADEEIRPALLVADRVFITPDRVLVAEGNVEALQGDTRLRASRIIFDRTTGALTIEGPIRIDQGQDITILASAAELDKGLQNGLLSGARMVMNQQLQLAALQMTRVSGRYTQLYKTAVTSCHVCEDGSPPLWQIRAKKVTHDQLERQLYFENAQFRILDVPVFYLPGMRLPDPTLERAKGFLIPSVRTTSKLGTGVKVPYFFPLGDSRDLTLSPYLSPKTRTLEYRYRQAFRKGYTEFLGAFTRDDLLPGQNRGFLFGFGAFDLPRAFELTFNIQAVSDSAYVVDYGLPDVDRLQSEVVLSRFNRDIGFRAGLINYDSLREGENESTLPTIVAGAQYERRFFPAAIGGELRFFFDTHGHYRTSDLDVVGLDVFRTTAELNWHRSWILNNGIRADWRAGIAADFFRLYDDSNYDPSASIVTPATAVTFSYPMTRVSPSGAVNYIEPILQLGWTNVSGGAVPNDESNYVEFDEGNLLSLSRFPAPDRREDGPTLVYGLNWSRVAATGWSATGTIGQVFRTEAQPDFTRTSGLAGLSSDVLLAGQVKTKNGLSLTGRTLVNDGLTLSKAELRGGWNGPILDVAATYLWLGADPVEGRSQEASEFWFDGAYVVNPNWTASADLRYDISEARATRAAVGLIYRNECVTVDLSLSRRYTSSLSVDPSTAFNFSIALSGFSVEGAANDYGRSCK